ncbi:MAG: response regulator transcription factor [Candidatus Binatia bacterium]
MAPQSASGDGARGHVLPFPSRSRERSTSEETKGPTKQLTILIVEDHNSLCEMLSLYFIRLGYHVRTATDGERALEIIASEEIHLVLLDLMLPRLDGFTVLKQLRESAGQRTPYVIVVSAGASERDRNKVLELGANEYMPKPFHLARLIERIRAVEKHLL